MDDLFCRVGKNVMREKFVVVRRGSLDGSESQLLHQKPDVT